MLHIICHNSDDHEDSNAKRIRELCPCSDEAMGKMKMAMTEYQIDQKTHPGKTTVDDLVKSIKKIAFGEFRTSTYIKIIDNCRVYKQTRM